MTEPWHRIKDFSERELDKVNKDVLFNVADRLSCWVIELEVISDALDTDMYYFGEVNYEANREIFWKQEYPIRSIYLSTLPLKAGGFYVEERVREPDSSESFEISYNYWRKIR